MKAFAMRIEDERAGIIVAFDYADAAEVAQMESVLRIVANLADGRLRTAVEEALAGVLVRALSLRPVETESSSVSEVKK